MTENMKIAIEAVNKWLYFGQRCPMIYHKFTSPSTGKIWYDNVPKFLVDIKWSCGVNDIYCCWRTAYSSGNGDPSYVTRLYRMLGSDDRIKLIEYVMHYFDE